MPKTTHPTKTALIECAADLLDKYRFDEITVEMVLDRSNISKGSLYHHFEDIYHLLEAAMISRFARYVDTNIASLRSLLETATVVTPQLTGTLLPGITRDSILSVAADLGYKTSEEMISIDDWRDGVASGEISEIFACGTAAVVSSVGQAMSTMGTWVTGDGQPGAITMQIRNTLLGIQHGTIADTHNWVHKVL